MKSNTGLFENFMAFSTIVTGFTEFKLYGTGHARHYFSTVVDIVGEAPIGELAQAFRRAQRESKGDDRLRAYILSDARLGPIARNIIKLWYVGIWYQLPFAWRDTFGARDRDTTHMVSPTAYPEGLLWPAIGANPSGAKAPGYGTWSDPPVIEGL